MTDDDIDVDEIEEDPNHHLRTVLADGIEQGGAVRHAGEAKVARVECERNLWTLFYEDTALVTFDADAWSTTANLGQYLDSVVRDALDLDEEEPSRAAGEKDGGPSAFR